MSMPASPAPLPTRRGPRTRPDLTLRVSAYERVAGWLLAWLIVLGTSTLILFLIWLTSRRYRLVPAVPVTVLEDVGGGGQGLVAGESVWEEPSPQELPELAPLPDPAPTLSPLIESHWQELEALAGSSSQGRGTGQGSGDGRGAGPGGLGSSQGVPAAERWLLRLSAENLADYARQLDYFGIELGVAGGGDRQVTYISRLSAARPVVRRADPRQEHRLRFLHQQGELREADRQLAAKAGVPVEGRVVFQFFSDALYRQLLTLEAMHKGSRPLADVRKTEFGVRKTSGGYEFFVLRQVFAGPP
jgi:hypothetical protein